MFINRRTTKRSVAASLAVAVLMCSAFAEAQSTGFACSDWAEAVRVDAFKRTLVGGVAADNRIIEWDGGHAHYGDFAVARLRRDGAADPAFGDRGSVIIDEGDFDSVVDLSVTADGVLAAGLTANKLELRRGPNDIALFKLDERGELSERFGIDGFVRLDLGGDEQLANVAVGPFGEIYLAGTIETEASVRAFVLRLDRFGRVDGSFGERGIVYLDSVAGIQRGLGMSLGWTGISVGGLSSSDGVTRAVVARLDLRGRLQRDFGLAGVAAVNVGEGASSEGTAFFSSLGASAVSLAIASESGGTQVATVLFDREGRARLGTDGKPYTLDAPSGTQDTPTAGVFWGRTMYIAGATYPDDYATGDAFLARTSLHGLIDPNFGVVSQHFDLEYTSFNDLALDRTALTAVGWDFGEADDTLPPSDALVIRVRHDGKLDTDFGAGGVVKLDFLQGALACGPRITNE